MLKLKDFEIFEYLKKILSFFEKRLSQIRDYLICSFGVLYLAGEVSFQHCHF